MKTSDETIAAIVVEVAGAMELRIRGFEPADVFAARATLITHMMLEVAKLDGALEAMRMMDHQVRMLEEEHPGATRAYVGAALSGMAKR